MEIQISPSAIQWFINEINLQPGDTVKFFAKYGGSSPIQSGFSLGFSTNDTPIRIGSRLKKEGILFFVEESDLWYFNGYHLYVDYNEDMEELTFSYPSS
ncbi:HesB/YadR/YfhF family protein [Alteribacillus iranensis]|uniref:Uncharacterized protein YneR n=1 Tax=Alteribacillus iranensis TaxID=930128 RepID=A0A1I2EW11_9BACI|nr:HesB/YadR/YfhF family protein [Alteribacillus iranensis]SFE96969.1 Uncharacterized protein YneR [Alteribacillus iranensis]